MRVSVASRFKQHEDALREEPRPQHYVFAHQALRGLCRDDPRGFFSVMASEGRRELVDGLWALIGRRLGATPTPGLARDVAVHTSTLRGAPLVLVRMPAPVSLEEAYFVAVVLLNDGASGGEPVFRYFTLELGLGRDGAPRTVLGEWVGEVHSSYGDGPDAEASAFLRAVEERLWDLRS